MMGERSTLGHELTIRTDSDGFVHVSLDGQDIGRLVNDIEFRHDISGTSFLRFVVVNPGLSTPLPDMTRELGSIRRTEEGYVEVTFGTR